MKLLFVLMALLVAAALAHPHEAHGWKHMGRAHKHADHTVIFAVKGGYNELASCDSELMAVSDPDSARYGQHLSATEVRALLADEDNVRAVEQWRRSHKVAFRTSPRGDYIQVTDSVERLEKVFDVEFHAYSHELAKTHGVRAHTQPRLPSHVVRAIDVVINVDDVLPDLHERRLSMPQISAAPGNGQTTVAFLNQYYGMHGNATHSSQGLYEALGQDFAQTDLDTFCQQNNLRTTNVNVQGPNNPGQCSFNLNACAEFTLDVEFMVGLAQGAPTQAFVVPDTVSDIFVYWSNWLSQQSNPAEVWSISYGGAAEATANTDKTRFASDTCKVGLMGVTVFVASGDDGVQGAQNCLQQSCEFAPSFPATCPYVTAVGATQGPELGQEEVVCSSTNQGVITSGSSASNFFPTPSWQKSALTAYLNSGVTLPSSNLYNAQGRFLPDVAFLGAQFRTVIGGQTVPLFGTSCASPSFGAVITMINSVRKGNGKSALGFINPALYKAPASAFNDITSGSNGCCSSSRGGCECGNNFGFQAAQGWDAASGFGSPKYDGMLSYFGSL